MRISDWSSDVCSSDLTGDWDRGACSRGEPGMPARHAILPQEPLGDDGQRLAPFLDAPLPQGAVHVLGAMDQHGLLAGVAAAPPRAFAGLAYLPLPSPPPSLWDRPRPPRFGQRPVRPRQQP